MHDDDDSVYIQLDMRMRIYIAAAAAAAVWQTNDKNNEQATQQQKIQKNTQQCHLRNNILTKYDNNS